MPLSSCPLATHLWSWSCLELSNGLAGLALEPGTVHVLAVQVLVLAQGGGWWGRKNRELCGTAAGLALLAARRGSQADLLACCCQKHQPHTLLPPLLYTCLQLWSRVLLACASLKPEWPCSDQLIKPWGNCCCVLTAWQLEQLTEGLEEYRARAGEVEGVHGQQQGDKLRRRTEEPPPISSNDLLVWLNWIF